MDRLSMGEKIAGGSAVLLFIFMFFDWFKVEVSSGNGLFSVSQGGNAWESFSTIDIILLIVVIVAVGVAVLRIIDPPLDTDIPGVDISRSFGIYLGLLASAGVAYGGYRAMQEEGTSFGEIGEGFSNRGGTGAGNPPQQPPAATPPPPPPPPSSGQGGPPAP